MVGCTVILVAITFINMYQVGGMVVFGIVLALLGVFQSTPYPGSVSVMGNYFNDRKKRGALMGCWTGSRNAGDVICIGMGALLISIFGDGKYYYMQLAQAVTVIVMAIIVFFYLEPYPQRQGLEIPEETKPQIDEELERHETLIGEELRTQ